VGVPILVYQLLSSVSMGMTSSAAKAYGDSAVAAFGDAIRLMTLGTYVVFGFLKGFQPIVGYNYGAKNYDRVKKLVNTTLKWSTIFCVVVAAIMLIFPSQLMSIFTKSDTELIRIGALSLRANGVIFALFGFEQVAMAVFLAMGKGTQGGLLSISRQGLFFIPAMLLLPRIFGLNGIAWVQPVADAFTILLAAVFMVQFYRDLRRLSAASVPEEGE
jgi:Na+-driven multidrug efflux pump